MLRSLNIVTTGLLGHQSRLDIIGSNIVNVNTTGFKAGRASFRALLGDRMGLNPQLKLGDGVGIASIDTFMNQGELEITGVGMDLAIEGDGFFAVKQDGKQIYSRAGAFTLDAEGRIIHLGSGGTLLGYGASGGRVSEGTALSELQIDLEQVRPAQATTFIRLEGNLDIDSEPLGSVIEIGPFLREASESSLLTEMRMQGSGATLGLVVGDLIQMNGWAGDVSLEPDAFLVEESSSYEDLASWMGAAIKAVDPSFPASEVRIENGRILIPGGTLPLEGLSLEAEGNDWVEEIFVFPETIEAGADAESGGQITRLLEAAEEDDLLLNLFSADGESLGGIDSPFNMTDRELEFTTRVGGVLNTATLTASSDTRLSDFMNTLADLTGLAEAEEGGISWREDGSILIAGLAGLENEIVNLSVQDAEGALNFGSTFANREIQSARDSVPHTLSTEIVGADGERQHLALVFRLADNGQGGLEWTWEAQLDGNAEILSGGSGTLVFGEEDGAAPELRFADGRANLTFNRGDGSKAQTLEILMGEEAYAVTQNDAGFDLGVASSDGIESGTLEDIQIDDTGTVKGLFSNGEVVDLARVALASFRNNAGLDRLRDNLYSESTDSGRPLWRGQASEGIAARIRSGALERSNVDLSQEFAMMITTQRGFQANAKIVTVGDEMLLEAVSLKR